jgi:hypothetical protein
MVDFREAADRGEIFGRALEDVLELDQGGAEIVQLDEGTAEGDARGEVPGMEREAGATNVDRLLEVARAAALFRELGEGDRRRILLDPASKIFDSLIVGHRP